jgi:acyl-CoA synthetase (NDP forming)
MLTMSPERNLRALATFCHFNQLSKRPRASEPMPGPLPAPQLTGAQPEWLGKKLLAGIGIPVPAGELATNAEQSVAVANRIGFPVAAKAQSAKLLHKTEAGGVLLDIADATELVAAYTDLTNRIPELDGVLVESMADRGVELVVGATRHPGWGPVVVVGMGGIAVEAIGDYRLLPADLAKADIIDELRKLRAAKLLGGFRGSVPVDLDAVAEVVAAIGRLMLAQSRIVELDINPLVVRPNGATALDALVVVSDQ